MTIEFLYEEKIYKDPQQSNSAQFSSENQKRLTEVLQLQHALHATKCFNSKLNIY